MRILLADSHETTRRAVEAAVQTRPSWSVCGIASSAKDAVALAAFLVPDVVLVDIGLPRRSTAELVPELRRLLSAAAVIALSTYESGALAHEFMRRGASGYLLKPDIGVHLTAAIERGLGRPTHPAGAHAEAAAHITAREREVLALLAAGHRNKEVAQMLGISRKTVETHRARIMSKLDLHSMSALVRYAIRHHLIEA